METKVWGRSTTTVMDDLVVSDNNTEGNISLDPYHEGPEYYRDPADLKFQEVLNIVDKYVLPVIIFSGLAGNLLSLLAFLGTPLRKSSSTVYLAGLAVSDTVFLLILLITWLTWFDIQLFHHEGWCQLLTYVSFVCGFLSVWYVVCFTVERYVAVFYPLQLHAWCTLRQTKLVVCCFALFALIGYNFVIWTSGMQKMYHMDVCMPLPRYMGFLLIMSNVDSVLTFLLPFIAILMLNIRIASKVANMYRNRKQLIQSSLLPRGGKSWMDECNIDRHTGPQLKTTKLLLVLSSVFLILHLPSCAFKLQALILNFVNGQPVSTPRVALWQLSCQYLYYANFSVNFLLYNLCGKAFRHSLKNLLLCRPGNDRKSFSHRCLQAQRSSMVSVRRSENSSNSLRSSSLRGSSRRTRNTSMTGEPLAQVAFLDQVVVQDRPGQIEAVV